MPAPDAVNVVSFYRFVDIDAPETVQHALSAECADAGLLGTVLLAGEGVNGTLAGSAASIRRVLGWLTTHLDLDDALDVRWTRAAEAPFRHMKVRVKREIVTLGRPDIRPQRGTARHVPPEDWNALIDDPGTLVIDARNHYEIDVGTFPRARDPGTDSFRQFPGYAQSLAAEDRQRPVAMFCTGGIRCEKAGALLQELGFSDVYQLQGGILNYLERIADDDQRWQGECFVFDSRVAVDRDLAEGGYVQCHACRRPLSSDDLAAEAYREGVSCPHCIGDLDDERAAGLEERRRQVALARERGERHLGFRRRDRE